MATAKRPAKKSEAISGTIELGDRVRDKVTLTAGIVEAITIWLNGCRRIQVTRENVGEKGKIDAFIFDEQQLELLAKDPLGVGPVKAAVPTGGPRDHTPMSFEDR